MRKLFAALLLMVLAVTAWAAAEPGRVAEFRGELAGQERDVVYREMEEWVFAKDLTEEERERRCREALQVFVPDERGSYDASHEWVEGFLERLAAEHGDRWWAWQVAGEILLSLPKHEEMVDGEFQRRGRGSHNSTERDRVRAQRSFVKAAELTDAPENRAEIYLWLADTFEQGYGPEVARLTDLEVLPEVSSGQVIWGLGEDRFLVDGRSPAVGADGQWKLPVLRGRFEDAETDYERILWLLSEAARLSPGHAPKAKLELAGMWGVLLDVEQVSDAGYLYLAGADSADDPEAPGEFEMHTLRDDETFVVGPHGIERRTIPKGSRYLTLLRELVEGEDEEVRKEAASHLMRRLADRNRFDDAAAVARRELEWDPKSESAAYFLDEIGPAAVFLPAGSFFTETDAVEVEFLSRGISEQTFVLWRMDVDRFERREQSGDRRRWPLNGETGPIELEASDFTRIREHFSRVAEWRAPLRKRGNHQQSVNRVAVPVEGAGFYLVTAKVGDDWEAVTFQINQTIALSASRDSGDWLDSYGTWNSREPANLFLIDAASGLPVEGARVAEASGGPEGISDHTGNVFGVTGGSGFVVRRPGFAPEILWVELPDDLDRSRDERIRSFFVSSQPLYRPGQRVDYAGWLRRPEWRRDSPDMLEKATRVKVAVSDPAGRKIHESELGLDEFGGFSGGFALPAEMVLGDCQVEIRYSVRVSVEDEDEDPFAPAREEKWEETWNWPYAKGSVIRVGEFRKSDLRVELEAGSGREEISATVRALYHSGEPVKGGTVTARLVAHPTKTEARPKQDWDFLYGKGYGWSLPDAEWCEGWRSWGIRRDLDDDPPGVPFSDSTVIAATGTTDGEGRAKLVFSLQRLFTDRFDYECTVHTDVQEFSGRTVGAAATFIHSTAQNQVFARPERGYYRPGEAVKVKLWTLSTLDEPVTGSGQFVVEKITGRNGFDQVAVMEVTTDDSGAAEVEFTPPTAGRYRCLFRSGGGERGFVLHVIGDGAGPIDGIALIPSSAVGKPGGDLELLVLSQDAAAQVWLFEHMPDGVRRTPRMIATKDHVAEVRIPLTTAGIPNFYLTAATVTKGQLKTAECRIVMPPQDAKLEVAMALKPGKREPGERAEVEIGVTDATGRPAIATLAVTAYDRALEDLGGPLPMATRELLRDFDTRVLLYRSQDQGYQSSFQSLYQPGCFFGWDLPVELIRPQGTGRFERWVELESEIDYNAPPELPNSVGGAAFGQAPGTPSRASRTVNLNVLESAKLAGVELRREFEDRAYWGAMLRTDEEGRVTAAFDLPDNLTSWRVQTWAFGKKPQFGDAEIDLAVSKPLQVRPLLPIAAVEGDQLAVGAMVQNRSAAEREFHVTMEADGVAFPARAVTLAAGGEAQVVWDVELGRAGSIPFRFRARSADGGLSDGVEIPLSVGPRRTPVVVSGQAEVGDDMASAALVLEAGEALERGAILRVRLEANPAAGALAVLPDLAEYPYGCTEQTLNRFLPTLVAWQSSEKLGIRWDALQRVLTADPWSLGWVRGRQTPESKPAELSEEKVRSMIDMGLARLAEMQGSDGAWGWFSQEDSDESAYMTALAVRGLRKAEALGFEKWGNSAQRGISWLESWADRRTKAIAEDSREAGALDAWVLLALSQADQKEGENLKAALLGARAELPLTGLIHLALSLDPEDENVTLLMDSIRPKMATTRELGTKWWDEPVEQRAWYLKLLVKSGAGKSEIEREIAWLLSARADGVRWGSTKSSALCVEAIVEAVVATGGADAVDGRTVEATVSAWGQEHPVSLNAENLWTAQLEIPVLAAQTSHSLPVTVSRVGRKSVRMAASVEFASAAPERLAAFDRGIRVNRQYFRIGADGGRALIAEGDKVKPGEQIEVRLELFGDGELNHVHLRDPLPAGFEPIVQTSGYAGGAYRESRTGETHFFVTRVSDWNRVQRYHVRVVTPGTGMALPAVAECMYLPEITGQSAARVVEVE